jgi:hypothetical protein
VPGEHFSNISDIVVNKFRECAHKVTLLAPRSILFNYLGNRETLEGWGGECIELKACGRVYSTNIFHINKYLVDIFEMRAETHVFLLWIILLSC